MWQLDADGFQRNADHTEDRNEEEKLGKGPQAGGCKEKRLVF
jgi:hypothetical protein